MTIASDFTTYQTAQDTMDAAREVILNRLDTSARLIEAVSRKKKFNQLAHPELKWVTYYSDLATLITVGEDGSITLNNRRTKETITINPNLIHGGEWNICKTVRDIITRNDITMNDDDIKANEEKKELIKQQQQMSVKVERLNTKVERAEEREKQIQVRRPKAAAFLEQRKTHRLQQQKTRSERKLEARQAVMEPAGESKSPLKTEAVEQKVEEALTV